MLAVTVGGGAREAGVDHERAEGANHAHHVAEHLALVPLRRRLVARFGEPVVERPREELLAAVEPPRLQQLLGADDSEGVEELGADDVLPALAAVQRQVGHARVVAARHAGDEARVFIVGMRAGVEHAGRGLQALEELHQAGRSDVIDRPDLGARGTAGGQDHRDETHHDQGHTGPHGVEDIKGGLVAGGSGAAGPEPTHPVQAAQFPGQRAGAATAARVGFHRSSWHSLETAGAPMR
jgi:hypothetical protein